MSVGGVISPFYQAGWWKAKVSQNMEKFTHGIKKKTLDFILGKILYLLEFLHDRNLQQFFCGCFDNNFVNTIFSYFVRNT